MRKSVFGVPNQVGHKFDGIAIDVYRPEFSCLNFDLRKNRDNTIYVVENKRP